MNQQPHSNASNPRRRSFFRRHLSSLLLLLVLGGVLWIQWPMVKGVYYGVAGDSSPQSSIPWRMNFDAALEESAKTGKPVLLDFTASWCPPCRTMKHDVWPDSQVSALASEGYIPVLLDVDRPENRPAAARYGISSIPSILIVNAQGDVLRRASFMNRGDMVEFLKTEQRRL